MQYFKSGILSNTDIIFSPTTLSTLVKIVQAAHYLNVAGCGGVVGSAGEGGVGDGVALEGGQPVLVFTVASSLFTALEVLPELCNLLESNGRGGDDADTRQERDRKI